jgi:6,7-dimethyl-8-ribityllumazine synthase
MSTALPERPEPLDTARHFSIVASRYNADYVDGMINSLVSELALLAPGSEISLIRVPGSFEVPLGVQTIAQQRKHHAIFALGVLWEGQTSHANLIATAVTNSLMNISLAYEVPVLHEVLVLQNEEQARARCMADGELNRGVEAARAAVRMLRMLDEVWSEAQPS